MTSCSERECLWKFARVTEFSVQQVQQLEIAEAEKQQEEE